MGSPNRPTARSERPGARGCRIRLGAALTRDRRPILGIIDQPISRERWVGAAGRPTTLNGAPVRCRACPTLTAATLFATTPEMFKGVDAACFSKLSAAVKKTRFGADCCAHGLVAGGFIDLVLEASLKPYDFCAMVPIVEGSGGLATDWRARLSTSTPTAACWLPATGGPTGRH